MNTPQTPSIWNRQSRAVGQAMRANLGQPSHPRVSIQGGSFQLIGADGVPYPAPTVMHPAGNILAMLCVIVGANGNKSRMYFPEGWDPHNPAPPLCFSDNGTAPSAAAQEPQAAFCGECYFSKWGSKISPMTNKGIPACQSKKKLAVIVLGDTTGQIYEFQVPPASLGTIATYGDYVNSIPFPTGERATDVSDIITMVSFEPGQTGILNFEHFGWVDSIEVDENGAAYACLDDQGMFPAQDGGWGFANRVQAIWDSGTVETLTGIRDQPFQAPAGWIGTGQKMHHMVQSGGQPLPAPQSHAAPAVTHQGPVTPAPYARPPGAPLSKPQQMVVTSRPAPAAPPVPSRPHPTAHPSLAPAPVRQPGPAQNAAAPGHGGARPGAGRKRQTAKPATVAPAPSQALQQEQNPQQATGQVVAMRPAVTRPVQGEVIPPGQQGGEGIPPFLQRQRQPAAPSNGAVAGAQAQGQFGVHDAPEPPAELVDAVSTAMGMNTEN